MPFPALILPILALAAQDSEPQSRPVTVTGHLWAPFISPMGEPFRARTADDNTLARWFYQSDTNRDGTLTAAEMQADAERFFATLDTDHDGEIGPEELMHYEWEIAPDIQVMSRTRPAPGETRPTDRNEKEADSDLRLGKPRRPSGKSYGLEGAARYSLLNMPEPVAAADTDFDRGITLAEFKQAAITRFQLLDTGRRGSLTLAQLLALLPPERIGDRKQKRKKDEPDTRIGNPLPPGD
jgi:hypothetical protein